MADPFAYEGFAAQPPSTDRVYTPNAYTPNDSAGLRTETEPPWSVTDSSGLAEHNHSVARRVNLEFPKGRIKHHEIIRAIGQGGMGSVFLARDRRLGRLVAIKILHHGGRARARLLAEARATAQAKHENIVIIYDIGMFQKRPYMILEYLSGKTLRNALSESRGRGLPRGLALDIGISVVEALSGAHKNGVIHRDLKPENVMLLDSGRIKVLDFGIARRMKKAESDKPVGTFAYMSPEQWLGRDVDPRSDIWAVGVLLFEVLSGAHPLAPLATRDLSMIADLDLPMPSLREVRTELGGLCDIVDRCLRKRKEERFESANELLAAFSRIRA